MYIIDILKKSPLFVFHTALRYCLPSFLVSPSFLTDADFTDSIIQEWKSFIRIGDGEMVIMLGGGIFYQKWEQELSDAFWSMIEQYRKESPYILGVTEVNFRPNSYLRKISRLRIALPMKVMFHSYFKKDISYADAAMFYKKKYIPLLREFARKKHVFIIANTDVISGLHVDFFEDILSLGTLSVSSENAFSDKNHIMDAIDEFVSGKDTKDVLLFCSCWPLSKFLVFEYAKKWIQWIDIWLGIELISTHFDEDYSHRL